MPVVYMSFECLDGLNVKEGSAAGTVDLSTIDGKASISLFFALMPHKEESIRFSLNRVP